LTAALLAAVLGIASCLIGLQRIAELLGMSAREPGDAIKSMVVILLLFAILGFLTGTGFRLWKRNGNVEPCARPNGGPTTRVGNSEVTERGRHR